MTLRWVQRTDAGDLEELVNRVAVMHSPSNPGTDGLVTNAEEGSVGRSQIRVDDPDGTFSIRGHRRIVAQETDAEEDDFEGVVWFGYTYTQTIEEGSPFDGVGRVWTIDLDDLNTVIERRIMNAGADRPAETDVERIEWLLTTDQAGLIDVDPMVSPDSPVDMDACDYRGQKLRDVIDDCAQQSGKNWYLLRFGGPGGAAGGFTLWYGHGRLDTFSSGVLITNDAAAVAADETGMTFVPSADTKLKRDPSRVFSGVWMDYDGGDVYETRPATATAFALEGRDTNSSAMNVKTATKASARANQYLGSIRTQEDVIETAIVVPAEKVNAVVHGHLVDVKVSWMPDYSELTTGRVLNRTVRQIGTSTYELALEVAVEPPPGPACEVMGFDYDTLTYDVPIGPTPAGFYPILSSIGFSGDAVKGLPEGLAFYTGPGVGGPRARPIPQKVDASHQGGGWAFSGGNYGQAAGSMPEGIADGSGLLVQLQIMVVGPGHLTIWLADSATAGTGTGTAVLYSVDMPVPDDGAFDEATQIASTPVTFPSIEFDVPEDGACLHYVVVDADAGNEAGWVYGGFDWTPAE